MRTTHAVAAALLVVSLGSGPAGASETPTPFQLSLTGHVTPIVLGFHVTGSGTATGLGAFTNVGDIQMTGLGSGCLGALANTHVETFTATDGSTLSISSDDVACPSGIGTLHGTGWWTVTAGTGRCAGATGNGYAEGGGSILTGAFAMTLTGQVSCPGF